MTSPLQAEPIDSRDGEGSGRLAQCRRGSGPREHRRRARRLDRRTAGRALAFVVVSLLAVVGSGGWLMRGYLGAAVVQRDIPFGEADGVTLRLDLARPSFGAGPFPAIVAIHGGGWIQGDKASYEGLIRYLAARGYVAASVNYRLAPDHAFPAQLQDVSCAVRWLRRNAQRLDVDPDRIGAMGSSAGAHLALMLGVVEPDRELEGEACNDGPSSRVRAVVSWFAPTDLTLAMPEIQDAIDALLGGPQLERLELARRASPVAHLAPGDATILTLHGTEDPLVPYQQARLLHEAANRAGVPASLVPMAGQGHGWRGLRLLDSVSRTVEFFDAQLDRRSEVFVGAGRGRAAEAR